MQDVIQDNDLSEFDESRDIIESLVDEYKACESPDYIKWGMEVYSYWSWRSPDYISSQCCWFYILLQDPNNLLTEEGNAKGTADPKLAI